MTRILPEELHVSYMAAGCCMNDCMDEPNVGMKRPKRIKPPFVEPEA